MLSGNNSCFNANWFERKRGEKKRCVNVCMYQLGVRSPIPSAAAIVWQSVFHEGGVCFALDESTAFPSSIAVRTSEPPSATHTWGVEGNRIRLKRCIYVFFPYQSTSEWLQKKSFYMLAFTYLSNIFKTMYYIGKITYINFTIHWVKV